MASFDNIFKYASVRCQNPDDVRQKLAQIVAEGPAKLQVISDFDYTMSRHKDKNGEVCWTTHCVMETETRVQNKDLGDQLIALKNKYMPIEFDPDLTKEEKTPHMIKWWETAHEMLVTAGFTKHNLEESVDKSKLYLRDGCVDAFGLLNELSVPFIVFSAGIGDIIDHVFQRDLKPGGIPPNCHIISNALTYDADGKVIGFDDPLVHTFNKNASVIDPEQDFGGTLHGRSNVVLLGDSLGDIHMDVGCTHENTVLKIGFLNNNTEKMMKKYLTVYDIVLVDDQTWDVPNMLLNAVRDAAQGAASSAAAAAATNNNK